MSFRRLYHYLTGFNFSNVSQCSNFKQYPPITDNANYQITTFHHHEIFGTLAYFPGPFLSSSLRPVSSAFAVTVPKHCWGLFCHDYDTQSHSNVIVAAYVGQRSLVNVVWPVCGISTEPELVVMCGIGWRFTAEAKARLQAPRPFASNLGPLIPCRCCIEPYLNTNEL